MRKDEKLRSCERDRLTVVPAAKEYQVKFILPGYISPIKTQQGEIKKVGEQIVKNGIAFKGSHLVDLNILLNVVGKVKRLIDQEEQVARLYKISFFSAA